MMSALYLNLSMRPAPITCVGALAAFFAFAPPALSAEKSHLCKPVEVRAEPGRVVIRCEKSIFPGTTAPAVVFVAMNANADARHANRTAAFAAAAQIGQKTLLVVYEENPGPVCNASDCRTLNWLAISDDPAP